MVDGTNAAAGSLRLRLTRFLGNRNVAYWHLMDKPTEPGPVAYWSNSGQKSATGASRLGRE